MNSDISSLQGCYTAEGFGHILLVEDEVWFNGTKVFDVFSFKKRRTDARELMLFVEPRLYLQKDTRGARFAPFAGFGPEGNALFAHVFEWEQGQVLRINIVGDEMPFRRTSDIECGWNDEEPVSAD